MKFITCAGFYSTGSSAISDLLTEFSNVKSFGNFEYRFLQDPDGISDLEYNLIDNNHRHNTSHAIKRFLKYFETLRSFGYGETYKKFGDKLVILSKKYVDEIVELEAKTYWHIDRINRGELFSIIDRCYSLVKRLFTGGLSTEKRYSLLTLFEKGYYSSISEDAFLQATRKFIEEIFLSVLNEEPEFLMVDQLVPPTNTNRYIRYFNNIKVIILERDPVDIFICENEKVKAGIIPYKNVDEFIKWYKITRKYRDYNNTNENILKLQFEDMIYKYDETLNTIIDFVGLDKKNHTKPKTQFKPEISIDNTNLKNKFSKYQKQAERIAKELPEYLYKF